MVHEQSIAITTGRSGCYYFSILHLAFLRTGNHQNAIREYPFIVGQGWMRPDCFVQNPAAILSYYTGEEWTARHEDLNYFPDENELEILRWENNKEPMRPLAHFVVGNGLGVTQYDPSNVLNKDWKLVSKRIFRRKA